jgi:hypothetical protein
MCVWIMKGSLLNTYDCSRSIRAPPWQRNIHAKAKLAETQALSALEARGDDEEIDECITLSTDAVRHFHVYSHVHRY